MATTTDILRTVVELNGKEGYMSGMSAMASATELAAQKTQILMQLQQRQGMQAAATGAALLALAGNWARLAGSMEQSEIAFSTLLKNSGRASEFIKELQGFAKTTPFEFMDLQNLSKRMLAFGFNVKEVIPMLRTLGDTAGALGGSPETLNRIIIALGQIKNKGRLMGQEMLQLSEAGVPVAQILQTQLGLTADQLGKIGEQGIKARDAIPALLKGLDANFGGGMEMQTGTFVQQLSNIADIMSIIGSKLDVGIIDVIKLFAGELQKAGNALGDLNPQLLANIGLVVAGAGVMLTMRGAQLLANTAKMGYNVLVQQSIRLEQELAAATAAETAATLANAEATAASAAARVAANRADAAAAQGATRLFPGSLPLLGPGADPNFRTGMGPGSARLRTATGNAAMQGERASMQMAVDRARYTLEPTATAFRGVAKTASDGFKSAFASIGQWFAALNPVVLAVVGSLATLGLMYYNMVIVPNKQLASTKASEATQNTEAAKRGFVWVSKATGKTWSNAQGPSGREWQRSMYGDSFEDIVDRKVQEQAALGATTERQAVIRQVMNLAITANKGWEKRANEMSADLTQSEDPALSAAYRASLNKSKAFDEASEPIDRLEFQTAYAKALGETADNIEDVTDALNEEAAAHYRLSQAAFEAAQDVQLREIIPYDEAKPDAQAADLAAAQKEKADKEAELTKKGREELLKAMGLENDARKAGLDAEKKTTEEKEKQKKKSEELVKLKNDYDLKLSNMRYGENSPQSASLVIGVADAEYRAAQAAAQAAWAQGDLNEAYYQGNIALDAYKRANDALTSSMEKSLGIGSAYADYLRSIGREGEADKYEKNQLASGKANLAARLFATGDTEGGWRTAAEAERLYRGSSSKGGLFGSGGGGRGPRFGAVVPQQAPVVVNINSTVGFGEGQQQKFRQSGTAATKRDLAFSAYTH